MAEASAASLPASARRKNTQLPSRKRVISPASAISFKMPADARLALPKDLGQVLDVELAPGKQREDAQARGLSRGAQTAERLGA